MASNIQDLEEIDLNSDNKPFEYWESFLSSKVKELLQQAEAEEWPFVPEEWQYGYGEHSEAVNNLNDLLKSASTIDNLQQKDILMKCLNACMEQGLYRKATAVLFLMDRFMYRHHKAPAEFLEKSLDRIEQRCPDVRIAPQLRIRRARILKDQSAIQEADELLQSLIQNIEKLWNFRTRSQLDCTLATCTQIRGVIHHNLGLPVQAALFVIESIGLYRSLKPDPDTKGMSSSLGILTEIFHNISMREFEELRAECHFFNSGNPLLEGAAASYEAAFFGRFENLFTCRHHRRGGEALLAFLSDLPERDPRRSKIYADAVYALTLSLYSFGHDVNNLRNREATFEFISAMFQMFVAHSMNGQSRQAQYAMDIATFLYEKYCKDSEIIIAGSDLKILNTNMKRLSLKEFGYKKGEDDRVPVSRFQYSYPKLKNMRFEDEDERREEDRRKHQIMRREVLNSQSDSSHSGSSSSDSSLVDPTAVTAERVAYGYGSRDNENVVEGEIQMEVKEGAPALVEANPSKSESNHGSDKMPEKAENPKIEREEYGYNSHENDDFGRNKGYVVEVEEEAPVLVKANQSESNHDDEKSSFEASGYGKANNDGLNGALSKSDQENGAVAAVVGDDDDKNKPKEDSPVDQEAVSYSYKSNLSQPRGRLGQANELEDRPYLSLMRGERSSKQVKKAEDIGLSIEPFKAYRARVFKYDVPINSWNYQDTLIFIQDSLELSPGKKGNHRDVFKLQFLSQEEPRAQYLGKRYRKVKPIDNYFEDVRIQMIARNLVARFNDRLKKCGWKTDFIQIVPAIHVQIVNNAGDQILEYMNVEPYVRGEFNKLTNNTGYVNKTIRKSRTDAATAFTHFTNQESGGMLMVVDLQGWVPPNRESTIILTDPAINSIGESRFSSVDMSWEGFDKFWSMQHPECNEICHALKLKRPRSLVKNDGIARDN